MLYSVDVNNQQQIAFGNKLNEHASATNKLQFFDGALPAACEDADDGTMIVQCDCSNPPGSMSSNDEYTFSAISQGTAVANGTITYWRLKNGSNVVIMQGDVGTSGTDIVVSDVDFAVDDTLDISDIVITLDTVYP